MILESQFVPYKYSKELADIGFNEFCLAIFNDKEEIEVVSRLAMNIKDFPICVPLWQQIFEWFSENYKIEVQIHKYREDAYFLSINNTYLVDDLDFKLKFKKSEVKIKALEICLKRIKK
jgi:hypothetical protein